MKHTDSTTHAFFKGYREACEDFGIYKDGVQRIGGLETPIREVIDRKARELDICNKVRNCPFGYSDSCPDCGLSIVQIPDGDLL